MAKKKVVKQMTDTKVTHVSLVGSPANDTPFLAIKSKDDIQVNFRVEPADIVIKSADQQLVYGIVYEPDKLDLQEEFMTAVDIQKSAHGFIADFGNIDSEHDFSSNMGTPVESYIAPQDFEVEGRVVKAGSWVLVVKCNDEAWEKVKAGEFAGFSLAGVTKRKTVEVEVDEDGNVFKGIVDGIKNALAKKDISHSLTDDFTALETSIWESYYALDSDETLKSEIEKSVNQFMSKIGGLSFVYKKQEANMVEEQKEVEDFAAKFNSLSEELETVKAELKEVTKNFEKSIETMELMAEKIVSVEKSTLDSKQVADTAPVATKKQFSYLKGVK